MRHHPVQGIIDIFIGRLVNNTTNYSQQSASLRAPFSTIALSYISKQVFNRLWGGFLGSVKRSNTQQAHLLNQALPDSLLSGASSILVASWICMVLSMEFAAWRTVRYSTISMVEDWRGTCTMAWERGTYDGVRRGTYDGVRRGTYEKNVCVRSSGTCREVLVIIRCLDNS